jgi:hypothetical protein
VLSRKILRHGVALIATVLLGGLLSATLVRLAPGFDSDEAELDPHLSAASIRALRETRLAQRNISELLSPWASPSVRCCVTALR